MLFNSREVPREERGGEWMAARSFIAETRSITQVYEILSGLLDGPERARKSATIFMSNGSQREEIERIRRRYEEKTGEPLLIRYRGEPCKLEKGKIAVIANPTLGSEVFGIVVSDLVIDNRMVDYMWRCNIPCRPLDQSLRGGTWVVNTRFGKIELAITGLDINWPDAARTARISDTESWIDHSPGGLSAWHSQPISCPPPVWETWSNYTSHQLSERKSEQTGK